ncbi:MAG: hypothetical protein KGO05_01190 [Chloroflexota bacterium]|nr:hypothetical protein [Chloroflexota bacterium]
MRTDIRANSVWCEIPRRQTLRHALAQVGRRDVELRRWQHAQPLAQAGQLLFQVGERALVVVAILAEARTPRHDQRIERVERPRWLMALGTRYGKAFGTQPGSDVVIVSIVLACTVAGFFVGYMVTRLYLGVAFSIADGGFTEADIRALEATLDLRLGDILGMGLQLDGALAPAVERAIAVPLCDLQSVPEMIAWSNAQLIKQRFEDAGRGFARALQVDPANPNAQIGLDMAQSMIGVSATDARNRPVQDILNDIVDARVYQNLYATESRGYDRAIEFAEKFRQAVKNTARDNDAQGRLSFYLACAYGQKAKATSDVKEREALRLKAIAAARDALNRDLGGDPQWKKELQAVWRPDSDAYDDDLAVFRDDPEFIKLLRRRRN